VGDGVVVEFGRLHNCVTYLLLGSTAVHTNVDKTSSLLFSQLTTFRAKSSYMMKRPNLGVTRPNKLWWQDFIFPKYEI
jgi:hypothetical protein